MSIAAEMASFIIPNVQDPIQAVFFTLMFGAALLTAILVKRSATPSHWENKWNGGTINDLSDDLDADHGSVSDISNAVATRWEKLSETMPGILLILGLLGTFLGLGIALNEASCAISDACSNKLNDSTVHATSMDGSMAHLMEMMQGLGTKFKTSTWGIVAFLTLKIWISYDGFEEKRLRWCIRKVKGELDSKRAAAQQQQQSEHKQFLEAIGQLGERLSLALQDEISSSRRVLQKNQELLTQEVELSKENNTHAVAAQKLLAAQLEKSDVIINNSVDARTSLEKFITQQNDHLCSTLQSEISANRGVLQNNNELLAQEVELSIENNTHAVAAQKLLAAQLEKSDAIIKNSVDSRTALEILIKQENNRLCDTLQSEISANRGVLQNNQELLTQEVELSKENNTNVSATRTALESFVKANTDNLKAMEKSSSEMAEAASRVGESAIDLKSAISGFKEGVASVLDSLQTDLNKTLSQMNAQNEASAADLKATIGGLQSGVSDVMATMKSDLSASIRQMNDSFGNNMEKMSGSLEMATSGIGDAINLLSVNVGKTMGSVEQAIGESLEIQKKTKDEFMVTSETLNINVEAMTGLVNQSTGTIKSGLAAISTSNQKHSVYMKGLGETAGKIVDSFKDNIEKLNVLDERFVEQQFIYNNHHSENIRSIEKLTHDIGDSFAGLIEQLKTPDNNLVTQQHLNQILTVMRNIDDNVAAAVSKAEFAGDILEAEA